MIEKKKVCEDKTSQTQLCVSLSLIHVFTLYFFNYEYIQSAQFCTITPFIWIPWGQQKSQYYLNVEIPNKVTEYYAHLLYLGKMLIQ